MLYKLFLNNNDLPVRSVKWLLFNHALASCIFLRTYTTNVPNGCRICEAALCTCVVKIKYISSLKAQTMQHSHASSFPLLTVFTLGQANHLLALRNVQNQSKCQTSFKVEQASVPSHAHKNTRIKSVTKRRLTLQNHRFHEIHLQAYFNVISDYRQLWKYLFSYITFASQEIKEWSIDSARL